MNTEPHLIVDQVIRDAFQQKASDIYWIPDRDGYRIVFRIGGNQKLWLDLPSAVGAQCVTRIKVLARLLTYKGQSGQDGVIEGSEVTGGKEIRVAVMPTVCGERVTLRLPDASQPRLYLEDLGFPEETVTRFRSMLQRDEGMIILTGPTGCGKSTTIYAMIRELVRNHQDPASIITVEDPVECRIDGISQVSLSRSNEDWNYPAALRASLRQDVKTLIVGEMRDRDVVKVALDAALTGHRIITTFHAGDIASVYARILHQGFEPFLVASCITGIISQRLIPGISGGERIPVAAILEPDDEWRELILSRPELGEIRRRLKTCPGADLRVAVTRLADEERIERKWLHVLS